MSTSAAIPCFSIDAIGFDPAGLVLPSRDLRKALRFVLPLPAFAGEDLRYPERYPADMRRRDGGKGRLSRFIASSFAWTPVQGNPLPSFVGLRGCLWHTAGW